MALKELTTNWIQALEHFDRKEYQLSLKRFKQLPNLSKIHFNLGMISQKLGISSACIEHFDKAIELDSYFSLAYFQRGVVFYYLDEIELALDSFKDAYSLLRKNSHINYSQLGLDYQLYESYCLFNISMCLLLFGDQKGLKVLDKAKNRIVDGVDTKNIKKALKIGVLAPEKIGIYEVDQNSLFRPPKDNILNEKKVNHLGESKLIAASSRDHFQGFSGRQLKEKMSNMTLDRNSNEDLKSLNSRTVKRTIPKRREQPKYQPLRRKSDDSDQSSQEPSISPTSTVSNNSTLSNRSFKSFDNFLKVKAYYTDCRVLKLEPNVTFSHLKSKLRQKFDEPRLKFKYKEGGRWVMMANDDDLFEAINGSVLELYCFLPSN